MTRPSSIGMSGLDPHILGEEHYLVARQILRTQLRSEPNSCDVCGFQPPGEVDLPEVGILLVEPIINRDVAQLQLIVRESILYDNLRETRVAAQINRKAGRFLE